MTKQLTVNGGNDLLTIYSNPEIELQQDKLLNFLNFNPPNEWVKEHPFIKGHKYVPIDKVEFLLKTIFKQYKIEILKTGMLMNTVEVTVRVHYLDPVTNMWLSHDGVGAQELQTKKDSGCLKMDMSNINPGAVTMALPIAKSMAIKDACDHLGKVFGADLNRKSAMVFNLMEAPDPLNKRQLALINAAKSHSDLEKIRDHIKPTNKELFDQKWESLSK